VPALIVVAKSEWRHSWRAGIAYPGGFGARLKARAANFMRVLLVHPEDSPLRGPWSRERWDLIVDLGKSSKFSESEWSKKRSTAVLRADCFRRGVEDVKQVHAIFSAGRGKLVDEEGIDWWDVASLLLAPEALAMLALVRVAAEINSSAELWATRPGWPAAAFAASKKLTFRSFGGSALSRAAAHAARYAGLARRFSPAQIKEIMLDKYDSGYRWRARVSSAPKRAQNPVVLLPSAYGNVSRMAGAYAGLLPERAFLMVATRESAKRVSVPANVQVRDLSSYAQGHPPFKELGSLLERWWGLQADLRSSAEMRTLIEAGALEPFPQWLRDGLYVRNAWRTVFDREPVQSVLCGDDSNLYTRIPVLLAASRKIPAIDFHHGAFDGRYLLKELSCETYLAKNEMELDYLTQICGLPDDKIMIGAPPQKVGSRGNSETREASAIFFSEPYESAGMRAEEVYREILPILCRIAHVNSRRVMVKLHPFESRIQRSRMLSDILSIDNRELVTVVDGPLTSEILSQAWFGVTVESSAVLDCMQASVCCFLCGWLRLSSFGYVEQYARFGVGELLQSAEQLQEAPARLADFQGRRASGLRAPVPMDPATLRELLTSGSRQFSALGPVS
jgi:hypothetical protein